MRTVTGLNEALKGISREIEELVKGSRFDLYDDLSGLDCNEADPEERLLRDELRSIMYKLEEARNNIEYLSLPIKSTGQLHKGSNGRYSFNDIELSSGSGVEALIPDEIYINGEFQDGYRWLASRVEHNGEDYYIVGYSGSLEGLTVRIRERRY